ncbi:MAG: hypothetical protein Q9201_006793 [Fulgogasparrea decipioides]
MELSSTSAFRSEMFQILVGPSAEPFYAHAGFLSKSKVLMKEVEGLWNEQQEKKIIWQHWSVRAAELLFQWLYTGVFDCPEPSKVLEQDSPTTSPSEEDALQLDYEDTFMTLAELYIMACYYMLDDLQHNVVHLLGKTLPVVDKPLHGSALPGNMMTLIRYIYKETDGYGYFDLEMREMRTKWVVQHYALMQESKLGNLPDFDDPSELGDLIKSPLESDREFVYDLVAALGRQAVILDNLQAKKRRTLEIDF